VDDKGGDFYRVVIRAGAPAVLNRLGFDGASKRSKPEYKRGDVIFCRVLAARPDADVEVTCLSNSGTKKEWSSGETVFGGLQEGCLVYVPLSYTKYLLRPECVLLESIAKHFAYEVSIGANGVVWLKAEKAVEQVVIRNCILSCQDFDDKEIPGVVDMIVRKALQSSK
jgi:exosome complex component RRP40